MNQIVFSFTVFLAGILSFFLSLCLSFAPGLHWRFARK